MYREIDFDQIQAMFMNLESKSSISFELKQIHIDLKEILFVMYFKILAKYFFGSFEMFLKMKENYKNITTFFLIKISIIQISKSIVARIGL